MAELTNLETKLGEVVGLAMAGQAATKKVLGLAKEEGDASLVDLLTRMNEEAAETEERGTTLAGTFEGKKTAILDEARTVKAKGADMMAIYLDAESDALDGFEFLTMAEAAEVGHLTVLQTMNERGRHRQLGEFVSWALPIQQRHFEAVLRASAKLAAHEDPNAAA